MARKKRRKKRIASRGSINAIILKSLLQGDKYGYEIIKDLEELSNGKIKIKQPSLYSSLNRFEDKKIVSSYWGDSDIGGRRHYYHLTSLGNAYYRKVVLKENDESIDANLTEEEKSMLKTMSEEKDMVESDAFESDETENEEAENFDEDDDQENDNNQDLDKEDTKSPWITESVSENVIRYNYVPTEESYKRNETTRQETLNQESIESDDNYTEQKEESEDKPWENLASIAKVSNHHISNTNYNVLYFRKPNPSKKVILDKDGIYKLRDENYKPSFENKKSVIIDNVGYRRNPVNIYGYDTATPSDENKNNTPSSSVELTEEEKQQRNKVFLEKFNSLTMSKMKPVSPPPQPEPEKPKPEEKSIDYIGKLGAILEKNDTKDIETEDQNNLFTYENLDNWKTQDSSDDDKFIDFESAQTAEPKPTFQKVSQNSSTDNSDDKEYIEKISSYSTSTNDVNIITYENKSKESYLDKSFILINKLKLVFGIIMTILMAVELTIATVVLKLSNLIIGQDKTIIIVAFVLVGLFALITIVPYFFSPNEHKATNFKLKYSIWFGLLTFLVALILIYCANALGGFALDNFKYFAVKLIVPSVLAINFIIGPLIYWSLVRNRNFYD